MNHLKQTVIAIALFVLAFSAKANTINFGTSWPTYVAAGTGNYAASPYNLVLGKEDGIHGPESQIATLLDSIAGTSFVAADIHKTDTVTELGGSDGYFMVPSGWNYLVVQYDGPHGGSVVIDLNGNGAMVPYDSSLIWGTGDKYAVSHYSVAGAHGVPDGGMTVTLLGLSVSGLAYFRRKAGV